MIVTQKMTKIIRMTLCYPPPPPSMLGIDEDEAEVQDGELDVIDEDLGAQDEVDVIDEDLEAQDEVDDNQPNNENDEDSVENRRHDNTEDS